MVNHSIDVEWMVFVRFYSVENLTGLPCRYFETQHFGGPKEIGYWKGDIRDVDDCLFVVLLRPSNI